MNGTESGLAIEVFELNRPKKERTRNKIKGTILF
jgi:hypothetical protein